MSVVQVTRGWTTLVKDLGKRAPYTNVDRVVKIIKIAWRGVVSSTDFPSLCAMTEIAPVISVLMARLEKVESENALGAFAGVVTVSAGSTTAVFALLDDILSF